MFLFLEHNKTFRIIAAKQVLTKTSTRHRLCECPEVSSISGILLYGNQCIIPSGLLTLKAL